MKRFLSIILLLFFKITLLYAQDTNFVKKSGQEKKELIKTERKEYKSAKHKSVIRQVHLGVGGASAFALNAFTSPLIYTGINGLANVKYFHKSPRYVWQVYTTVASGTLGNRYQKSGGSMQNVYGVLRADYWRPIKNVLSSNYFLLLGAAYRSQLGFRTNPQYTNSAMNMEWINSMMLSSRVERLFFIGTKNRKLKVSYDFALPVFSTSYHIPYGGINPYKKEFSGFFDKEKGFFKAFGVDMHTELAYFFRNGNQLSVTYTWNYWSSNPGYYNYKGGINGVFFSWIIKLDNNEEHTRFYY